MMLPHTLAFCLMLLNRNITAYVVENGALSEGKLFSGGEKEDAEDFLTPEELKIARWAYENRQRAGASTHHFPQAKCLYLAIRSGNNALGVIGIPLQKETLDSFEYSILLSVINECALAMEKRTKCHGKREKCSDSKKRTVAGRSSSGNFHDFEELPLLHFPVCRHAS